MDVPLNDTPYFDFITSRFDTGAVADADSAPTFEVFEDGTDTDIGVGGTATKRASKTGDYRASFAASAANGFEAGKYYNVVASATVNSVAGKGIIGRFRCMAAVPAVAGDVPSANANADALLDRTNGVETGLTLRQALRLEVAGLVGKFSGATASGSTTVHIRDINDAVDRIIATCDQFGNRTAVTVNVT